VNGHFAGSLASDFPLIDLMPVRENVLERLGLPELAARWRAEMQQQPGDRRDGERRGR